jgi:hypothetical protein
MIQSLVSVNILSRTVHVIKSIGEVGVSIRRDSVIIKDVTYCMDNCLSTTRCPNTYLKGRK